MKPYQRSILALLLCLVLVSRLDPAIGQTTAPDSPATSHLNASAALQGLLEKDEAARKAGDSIGRLQIAIQLRLLLKDAGDAILALAHAYSVTRDSAKVFETLRDFARMGYGDKRIYSGEDKKFSWLTGSPGFSAVCRRIQENGAAVNHAVPVLRFQDTGYLAEDIDYDKQGQSFLFTSILQHAVFRLTWSGNCRKFASSPSGWPIMAIKIDPRRGLVWATEVAMPGFDGLPDSIKGRSALCCFDLGSGRLKQRLEAPDGAQWGDMILDTQGDPIVSDGQSGAIFRLRMGTWQRLDKGDFISPQTPALTDDGKSLIVPDYERGLAVMDIENGSVAWIQNNPANPCALNGIDGVYNANHRLFITQNGVDPERVVQLRLNKQGRRLAGYTIIEKATPGLGEPTHGVIIDGSFYYIANSGWDVLDQHGNLKTGSRMSQPTLMRYRLTTLPD